MRIMTGPTIRETNPHISVVLHSLTVARQDSKGEAERVGRRFVLLKDKNYSLGELVLTHCRKSRGKHAVAKEGGKGYVIYQTDSEATVATLQIDMQCWVGVIFLFCLPPNLIQQSSYAGHCVRRGGT